MFVSSHCLPKLLFFCLSVAEGRIHSPALPGCDCSDRDGKKHDHLSPHRKRKNLHLHFSYQEVPLPGEEVSILLILTKEIPHYNEKLRIEAVQRLQSTRTHFRRPAKNYAVAHCIKFSSVFLNPGPNENHA